MDRDWAAWKKKPGISTVAPNHVRDLLASKDWSSDVGTLAIETVMAQLAIHDNHAESLRARESPTKVPSLFDSAALKVAQSFGNDAEEDIQTIQDLPHNVLSRIAWKFENIPYFLFREMKPAPSDEGEDGRDVDEWVLRNEKWLRDEAAIPQRDFPSLKRRRIEHDDTHGEWSRGLVRFSSHADSVFPDSILTVTSRTVTRPPSLPGFKVLDGKKSATLRIQPSVEMFAKTFDEMTNGLLKDLNWKNVFVAGGIVLGALLCAKDPEPTNTPKQWTKSDVDLYIHGLGPVEANAKVQHIFEKFKTNLPAGAPVLVVRNSMTITFFSKYPLRRIQVVLKLVGSPKNVLLNFDLDVCAIGWDGTEVWMLPRAARALETGYTTFTMDLIHGHYLGNRRATQEQRVFKYADKGYGIRILPSYMQALEAIKNDTDGRDALNITVDGNLDFEGIVEEARAWTLKAVKLFAGTIPTPPSEHPAKMSHAVLQERSQTSEDPARRSCLSGLKLFMRHVALWEYEVAGDVVIDNTDWAAPTYDNLYADYFGVSYNDVPDYSWNDEFTLEGFVSKIAAFNGAEELQLDNNLDEVFQETMRRSHEMGRTLLVNDCRTQRMTYAESVEEILRQDCDIHLPLWLPKKFLDFADDLIPDTVRDSGVPGYNTKAFSQALRDETLYPDDGGDALRLVFWRITNITMWQQLNRTIDEVHEVLWSFHHANAGLNLGAGDRALLLMSQFGRRAIRQMAPDEYGAFTRWVAKEPARLTNHYGDMYRIDDPEWDEEEDL